MRTISHKTSGYAQAIEKLCRRAEPNPKVESTVAEIIANVRKKGDAALVSYARKFDKARLDPGTLQVTSKELKAATRAVDERTREIIAASRHNVSQFANKSLRRDWKMQNAQGAQVGEVFHPFERVGIYVPGGSAPLVSTSIMTVAIAKAAGVPEIVVCTPCGPDRAINQALLYALHVAGATEIYRVGGAHAIAAMAWGTDSIVPVSKIFGPGNSYVVEAKRQVFGVVAIDLLPGPSEVLVLSDKTGRADWIAADLLAQAEHGGDSVAGLVSNSKALINDVSSELERQLKTLSRQKQLQQALEEGSFAVHVPSMSAGVELVNAFAPEHVTVISGNEDQLVGKIRTAGAIFVGNHSPVAAGDFLAGPSHTLPTGGAGKSFAGLTVDQFQRRTSIVKLGPASIKKSAPMINDFSALEGLDAHGRSAMIRLE